MNTTTPEFFLNSTLDLNFTSSLNQTVEKSSVQHAVKYIALVWLIIGIPGNAIAGLVWAQKKMRPSSGIFLAVLALDELIFLIFLIFLEMAKNWSMELFNRPVLCNVYPIFMLTTQQLSPLLVLSFTVQRYVAICHPFMKEKLCTMRKSYYIMAGLVIFCFLLNLPEAYFWILENNVCDIRSSATEGGFLSFWFIWHFLTEVIIFGAVPFTILILNILVIFERKRLSKAEKALNLKYQLQSNKGKQGNVEGPKGGGSGNRSSATTLTLLAVSTFLIVTVLPVTICYILMPVLTWDGDPPPKEDIDNYNKYQRILLYNDVRLIIEEIGKSHYALNIFIYILTGKMFRKQLKILFTRFCGNSAYEKDNPYRIESVPRPNDDGNSNKKALLKS